MNEDRTTTEKNHMNDNATENTRMNANMKRGNSINGSRAVRAATIASIAAFAVSAIAGPTAAAGKVVAKPITKAAGREVVEKAAREAAEKAAREVGEKIAREVAERAAREGSEKVTRELAERAAREGAEKIAREAGEKVARGTTAKVASRTAGERIVETVAKPKVLLAAGAGTAVVVGSHNVSKGARNAMENVGEVVRDIAENHPEMLPEVIKQGGKPVTAAAHATSGVIFLLFALIALWFFLPAIRLARARMAARATKLARKEPHRDGVGQTMSQGDIVEAEYEMRG
jgi:hypothetical protein